MAKIINFHDVHDRTWFEETLDVIQDLYEVIPFEEIQNFYKGKVTSKNITHLTVDDGHSSTYSLIYPILKERGLTASIFVSPKIIQEKTNFWYSESSDYDKEKLLNCIGEILNIKRESLNDIYPRSLMKVLSLSQNWEIIKLYQEKYYEPTKCGQYITLNQLLELERSGVFDIGAHTMNHPILANENDLTSELEIKKSIIVLGELLNRRVTTFAYPNGSVNLDFGKREIKFLREAEVEYSFSFEFKNLAKNDNLLSIPRYGLYHGNKDFVRKKLKYGAIWEPIKKRILNNEDKYREELKKKFGL
ncbi:polysaccharide deacetylase family protein [Kaistella flava (ex Peng et al. 2021)]|uniref:Polysaccharide deacetylase family protein n=1 Tax=Kaistella flava (ex Peng et al. 2021) TaxID=2038776 RepID=A0A7M2YBZ4_9FLAO|nr:polysaccharide deacetylase family protein [Kaistella flava (ex Peng et al. 2021)]QOW10893.1 polysaccharide deacetylase family protein [Kaistella flava (ex Peng et al. 2021)]